MGRSEVNWGPKPEVLKAIPVSAIHDFLTRRGWVQAPSSISQMRYYEHSEMRFDSGQPMYYYFPATDQFPEYQACVLGFIENQARFWKLDPWAVLKELTGGPLAEPVRTSVPA